MGLLDVLYCQKTMTRISKKLEDIGLSDKEALVYVASLELGPAPAQQIAQQAGIKRATTYVMIESLTKRGLMSSVEEGKKTLFFSEDPDNLLRVVQREREELKEREELVGKLVLELNKIYKTTGERPVVRFFDGIEGIKTIRGEYLKASKDVVYGVMSHDEMQHHFPNQKTEVTDVRVKRHISSKMIYTRKDGPVENATDPSQLREARFVPHEFLGDGADITIYSDKVSLLSLKGKPSGVLIENKQIAQYLRRLFELAWKGLESTEMSKEVDKE